MLGEAAPILCSTHLPLDRPWAREVGNRPRETRREGRVCVLEVSITDRLSRLPPVSFFRNPRFP